MNFIKRTGASAFEKPIENLYKWCRVIDENLAFILRELPTLRLPDDMRGEVSATCTDFQDAIHDVIEELRILEDKLGLHPGQEPYDPGVVNRDPRATLETIERWLSQEAEKLNGLVKKLWALQERDPNTYTLVNALVTESATNIHKAVAGAKAEMRDISGRLGAGGKK